MKTIRHLMRDTLIYVILAAISLGCARPVVTLLDRYLSDDLALVIGSLTGVVIFGTMDVLLNIYGKRVSSLLVKLDNNK